MEVHRKDGEIENRPVSKGGKLFDFLTYFGIAGVGTFLITIPTAAVFMKGGKFHGAYQWVERNLQKVGLSQRMAEHGANTFATVHGGNIMLLPVGIMEHYRTRIVQAFNRMLNDPTDPKSIEDAPPQTASSIIKARAIATATVFTGFVGTETLIGKARFEGALKRSGDKFCEILKKPKLVSKGGEMVESWTHQFGRTGALDLLATISSASLLYVGSHFFARKSYEKKAEKAYIERKERVQQRGEPAADIAVKKEPAEGTPSTTIRAATREEAVAPAPQAPEQPVASL